MKTLMIAALLSMTSNVWAEGTRTLLKDSKVMDAEVNQQTVLCSAKGYGLAELKINIKALDGWTLLDHSNLRFGDRSGLPCMTAGACRAAWEEPNRGGFSIDDLIQNNPRVEKIKVNRVVTETRQLVTTMEGNQPDDPIACERLLTESLDTVVGGIKFAHSRTIVTSEKLPASACKL